MQAITIPIALISALALAAPAPQQSGPDILATTDDGRRVALHSDMTWEFTKPESANASVTSFRGLPWGATKKAAIDKQGSDPVESSKNGREEVLIWKDTLAGLDVGAGYLFIDDQLVEGTYVLLEMHSDHLAYYRDFQKLKSGLTEKYGKPSEDVMNWHNDLYKDDRSDWGMAIAAGHLTCGANWSTPETKIAVAISGDNFRITIGIQYQSKRLSNLKAAIDKKKDGDKF